MENRMGARWQMLLRWAVVAGMGLVGASLVGAQEGGQDPQQEKLVANINQVALTQEDLPAGWTLLEERVQDPIYFHEMSELTSMFTTLPETGFVNLGQGITPPGGSPFNVEYFAFVSAAGATTAEEYLRNTAQKNNWLVFRLGSVFYLVCSNNQQVKELIAQKKMLPFLEKLLDESIQAEQGGNLTAAEQGYFAIVKAAPIYAKAWLRLGTIYQRSARMDAAHDAYQKAVDASKTSPLADDDQWQALVGLGLTTVMTGTPDAAIPILDQARTLGGKLGPDQEAKSDYFLAVAYASKNDEDKFAEYLEAAFDIEKSEGKKELLERAKTDTNFDAFKDKKKFKKLLKKFGKD